VIDPKSAPVAVRLRPEDNVAIAARHLAADTPYAANGQTIRLRQPILLGHKFAVAPIKEGEPILKYGQTIGFATGRIEPGEHVHVHNVSCVRFERDYAFGTAVPPAPVAEELRHFDGYLREDGRVGTRNFVAVISSVNCSATVCQQIVERFRGDARKAFPNVDGVFAVTHKTGCGMAASGTDRDHLTRALGGFARHPNVFDYVVIGLGCEVNQASELVELQNLSSRTARRPRVINIQGTGGIARTVEAGIRAVAEILPHANDVRRTRQPAERLILGTECGGSDGNSGVTANPALGIASDLIVAQGGTAILSETPEIYGAEHLLTRRAVSRAVGEKLVERIRWWEWYTSVFGAEINNNPSHGNKEGGLTTIYEKSLGAIAKGGNTALVDVYRYAEPVTAKGFVVMDTPGFDPPSVTGMVAGGANVVVFTTGRGSVFGCKPTPSIKVATNTPMFEAMEDDMDVDAGVILAGTPVEVVGRQIFELILDVASGRRTKSELNGTGEEEFVPWTIGPVL
jgi:altronate hydrolase